MKLTNRQRSLRKLVLPLIAVGMMTTAMALDSLARSRPTTTTVAPAAAQR